jgi:L-threonylcarbamoyladenylate synthase
MNHAKVDTLMNKDILFIHPTDTVFGLSAPFESTDCYNRIYQLKGRSETKPLGILLENAEQISSFSNISKEELKIFLPLLALGMTLILPRKNSLPLHLLTQSDCIGVRIPNHTDTKAIISEFGPLMSTSANISGKNPVSSTSEAKALFHDESIRFIDGITPEGNIHSTIVKYTDGKISLIREGNVPKEKLIDLMSYYNHPIFLHCQ